jgi:hypothetical protein
MRHDLPFLCDYAVELGFSAEIDSTSLLIDLGEGARLSFVNAERDEDCLIGFVDAPWHFHGATLTFADPRGHYAELDHLALLDGLARGAVLICTRLLAGEVNDRWLSHAEFSFLGPADHLLVRRAVVRIGAEANGE